MQLDRVEVLNLNRRTDKRLGAYGMLIALQVPDDVIVFTDAKDGQHFASYIRYMCRSRR